MTHEDSSFRNQLIGAQSMTASLRQEYQKELDALLHHRLTPWTRLLTWGGMIAAIVTAVLCGRAMIRYPQSAFVNGTFVAVALMTAGWFGRVIRQGSFERRASFVVVERFGGIATAAFVLSTLFRGMHSPSDPGSIFGGIMAVMLTMVGFAWGTGNRIAAANMEVREHLLRVESRLADLAERVEK